MSRIGKLPIPVPEGVEVALETGNRLSVTGSRGTLQRTFAPSMLINVETGTITIDRPSNARIHRSLHGLTRTLVANMVQGVSGGFTRDLDLVGVGFRAARQGGDLIHSDTRTRSATRHPRGSTSRFPSRRRSPSAVRTRKWWVRWRPKFDPSASPSRTRARASCIGARSSAARRASPARPARPSNENE
jgi:hypothetical protein